MKIIDSDFQPQLVRLVGVDRKMRPPSMLLLSSFLVLQIGFGKRHRRLGSHHLEVTRSEYYQNDLFHPPYVLKTQNLVKESSSTIVISDYQARRDPSDVFDSSDAINGHDRGPLDATAEARRDEYPHHGDSLPERNVNSKGQQKRRPPVEAPSINPSMVPSDSPSGSPFPSWRPSLAPSEMPTLSYSPMLAPSDLVPSEAPSVGLPSSQPSGVCEVQETGFFGDTTENRTTLLYGYEVEYQRGANSSDILVAIEGRVAETVVPVLFPDLCPDINATTTGNTTVEQPTQRWLHVLSRRLAIVGFSPRPDEQIFENVQCTVDLADPTNNCDAVQGSMTLFLDDVDDFDDQKRDAAVAKIEDAMNKGSFGDAHQAIVRVTYRDFNASGFNEGPKDPESRSTQGGSDIPIYAWVLIAIGVVLLIGIAFYCSRNHPSRVGTVTRSDALDKVDSDAELNMYEPPPEQDFSESH